MNHQLDRDIRVLLSDAADRAPAQHPWETVTKRALTATYDTKPEPRHSALAPALAAALVMLLVGGIFVSTRHRDTFSADRLVELRDLSTLTAGDVIVPTVVPDGWRLEPVILWNNEAAETVRITSAFAIEDPASGARGRVRVLTGMDDPPEGTSRYDLAGLEWMGPGSREFVDRPDQVRQCHGRRVGIQLRGDEFDPLAGRRRPPPVRRWVPRRPT